MIKCEHEQLMPNNEHLIKNSANKCEEIFDINDNKSSENTVFIETFQDDKKPAIKKKKKKRVTIKWKIQFKKRKRVKKKSTTSLQTSSSNKAKTNNKHKKEIPKPQIEIIKTETCKTCGKSFFSIPHLTSHIKMAHASYSLKCNFCEKTFKAAQHLSNHLKIHSDEMTTVKDICDETKKTFVEHCDDKEKFTCRICEKSMTLKSSLYRHMRQQHSNNVIKEKI